MEVKIFLKNGVCPTKGTKNSAGYDVYCIEDASIMPSETTLLSTGIFMQLPPNYECQIRSRSGLAKKGLIVLNSPGTIDSDYRDEVKVMIRNITENAIYIQKGDRIAQMVFCRLPKVEMYLVDEEEFEKGKDSGRTGGFGSTGR